MQWKIISFFLVSEMTFLLYRWPNHTRATHEWTYVGGALVRSQVTGVKQEGTVSQVRHHRSDDGENHGEVIPGVIVTVTRLKWSSWCFSYFSAIQQLQLLEMYKEKLQIELLSKAFQWRKQLLEDYQMFLFLRLKRILYEKLTLFAIWFNLEVYCQLIGRKMLQIRK